MNSVLLFFTFLGLSEAFLCPQTVHHRPHGHLNMAPKFDKATGRWSPSSPAEGPEAGYGPLKSLLLRGPKPFLSRVFTPDDYEQGVYKFMATDKVSREVAQGNMDRYLENAQDWAFERLEAEQKGRPYPEYHVLDKKQLVLTLIWSAGVFALGGRAAYSLATGEYYWAFLH
ncbi:hypothetical protein ACA910_000356 [Epithemia clementina (nom. ined.)]